MGCQGQAGGMKGVPSALAFALLSLLAGSSALVAQERAPRMHGLRVPVVDTAGNHLAGCYHLALGPWSQRTPLGPPSPTEIFRLDTTPINNGSPDARVAARVAPAELLPPADPRARWLRPAWWRTIGADSIVIVTWSATTEAEVFYG